MPLGTTYGSLAYVALYIWNKTGNLHGCASSTEERRGKNGSGVVLLFAPTKALSSCLLGRPLSRWSAAAHPSSGESSKFEPDVIVQGSFLLAFPPLDSSGDKSMKSFEITWQLSQYVLFLYLIGREKKMSCYIWIRDCKSKRGIVMRNLTQDQVIVFPSNDISHSRGKEWYILKKMNELLQAIQWFQNNLIVYFYDSNIPFPRPIKSRHF